MKNLDEQEHQSKTVHSDKQNDWVKLVYFSVEVYFSFLEPAGTSCFQMPSPVLMYSQCSYISCYVFFYTFFLNFF